MSESINKLLNYTSSNCGFEFVGRVNSAVGTTIEVTGVKAPVGARCEITLQNKQILADVIGFKNGITTVQPLEKFAGITPDSVVRIKSTAASIFVSDRLIGNVIDPVGNVIIGEATQSKNNGEHRPLLNDPLSVSERGNINELFDTGVKVINALLPMGIGQRVGLFAGTGVGKSVLMAMITKFSEADIVVIGLVGERGREVAEFYYETLDDVARAKSIIVAAPADTSPIMRLQCPETATSIAEFYRDQGLKVLLLIDSVTRYAQAQREVALASGEAPATKGYPPSVFTKLPTLIERTGKTKDRGSITAIYTVLTEGDDLNDPIADAARGVLDGHFVLSRDLAARGIYPALDVTASISRLAHQLVTPSYLATINDIKSFFFTLNENIDLVSMGLIEKGKNKKLDIAIKNENSLYNIIKQNIDEKYSIKESSDKLAELSLKIKEL